MMSNQDISCGLEYAATPDLQACLTEVLHSNYSFIVSPIVHPRFRRHHVLTKSGVPGFTRSDMLLSPQDWTVRIVGRLSPYLDVDTPCPVARQRHEDCMNEELSYCRGLALPAIMTTLHGRNTTNLSRILYSYYESSHHPSLIWTCVPLVCSRTLQQKNNETDDDNEEAFEETWQWWSMFHEQMEWDKRIGVVLELTADLPPQTLLKRWLGEPVKAVIVPTSIFHNNKKGYPVLSRVHQQLLISLVERDAQVIVRGARRSSIEYYVQFLHRMWQRRPNQTDDPMLTYARGWEDFVQIPLQPLAENLDTHTYNVFEKDPVKYDQYQRAIAKALIHLRDKEMKSNHNSTVTKEIKEGEKQLGDGDKVGEKVEEGKVNNEVLEVDNDKNERVFTVMVLGAGRGPLVRATLNASDITRVKVKVIAVEKNPCAVVVLAAQARELWRRRDVTVLAGDMRHIRLDTRADLIVSELLGSWGDNELSPECLDGAAGLLSPRGLSIPAAYTSHAAPISSPRLWAAARAASTAEPGADPRTKNLETLWVVYMQNKHDIAETKPLFRFEHPSAGVRDHEGGEVTDHRGLPLPDNRRCATLSWTVDQDNVMHGFGGYFDCSLFGDETLSIVPDTHSPGMISWFPVFIPIRTPLRVTRGDTITATFWRCASGRRVWYEWIAHVGRHRTPLHNPNGRSSVMLL